MPAQDYKHPAYAKLLTRPQAAAWIGVSTRTLDEWAAIGRLSSVKIGGRVYYDRSALRREFGALVAAGRRPAHQEPG